MQHSILSSVLKKRDRAPPVWCRLQDQNFRCQKIGQLANRSFTLSHSPGLPIQDKKFATVLSVYAPTLHAEFGVKEAFYRDLHDLLQQVASKDKLLILGDNNARVGRNSELWKGV